MQLSYRGQSYTPEILEISIAKQFFEGQFLGISGILSTTYRIGMPNAAIPLTYRGQLYLKAC